MPQDRSLQLYYRKRNRCKVTFPCPVCRKTVSSKMYEKNHAKTCLELNPALKCVWCRGTKSWKSMEKVKNVNHLLECWANFVAEKEPPLSLEAPKVEKITVKNPKLINSKHTCRAKLTFGRSKLSSIIHFANLLTSLLYELDPYDLFRDENLNKAAACVLLFLKGNHEFYHVMVRTVACKSFFQAMNGDARVLPFSCCCDGGHEKLNSFGCNHLHAIVVYPKTAPVSFRKSVQSKIKIPKEKRPFKSFKCVYMKSIQSAMHLVSTIRYLSNRECSGTFGNKKGNDKKNHFYISLSLPKDCRLALCSLWEGGIEELIDLKYRNTRGDDLVRVAKKVKGIWKVPILQLPGIEKRSVLPVRKEFRPVNHEGEGYVLYLMEGRKLHFERDDPSMTLADDKTWCRIQADGGNVFYSSVGLWTPRRHQQRLLDGLERQMIRNNTALEKKDEEMQQQRVEIERQKVEIERQKVEIEKLKQINRQLTDDNEQINRQTTDSNEQINRQITNSDEQMKEQLE